MKSSLLALVLILSILFTSAQEKSSSKVLMFSGSSISYGQSNYRNLTADTLITRNRAWGIGSGIMYGQWKNNTLLYYGLSFSYGGSSFNGGNKSSSFTVSPTIGLTKRYPITTSIYYLPSAELYLGYSWTKNTYQGITVRNSNMLPAGIMAYPFSIGMQATRKLDVVLTLGNVGIAYFRNVQKEDLAIGQSRTSNSSFNFGGQLNSLGIRLLLKI
jgi:hypothetical protein